MDLFVIYYEKLAIIGRIWVSPSLFQRINSSMYHLKKKKSLQSFVGMEGTLVLQGGKGSVNQGCGSGYPNLHPQLSQSPP